MPVDDARSSLARESPLATSARRGGGTEDKKNGQSGSYLGWFVQACCKTPNDPTTVHCNTQTLSLWRPSVTLSSRGAARQFTVAASLTLSSP